MEKRVHGNEGNTLPWAFKNCPRSLYFPLLMVKIRAIVV